MATRAAHFITVEEYLKQEETALERHEYCNREIFYTYPDVVISCKPERFDGNFLLNPVVIIEVLSDSAEAYDRGKKFEMYRQIESFREYLLVAQELITFVRLYDRAMATQAAHFITVEEYLKQEEMAVGRHEYFNGEIFAMSGGTPNHTWIAMNIAVAIHPQLKSTGCRVAGADMGIKTPQGLYTYPDVVISCSPESFDGNFLLNPVVIVEVLSESTEAYDRGKKFEKYRQIESFREYLLVAQDRMHVEHYVRGGSLHEPIWNMREFNLATDIVFIEAVTASLPLDLIYINITLEMRPVE